ncbi:MAG TPA: hypothetical protein VE010_15790 [Thermoanaerobaculia bacterium]|nr:hypothetical protein [Thermoanaerobaculia bacterium]
MIASPKRVVAASLLAIITIACGQTETAQTTDTITATATPPIAPVTETAATAATATTASTTTQTPPEDTTGSDFTGAYFPMAEFTGEFAELDHLLVATIDDNGEPAPLNGFLRPKKQEAKDYVLAQPVLSGRNLTFTTAAVNGVHYAFTGAFQRLGNFQAEHPPYDEPMLVGTLTKLRDGKTVASTPVNFAFRAGD